MGLVLNGDFQAVIGASFIFIMEVAHFGTYEYVISRTTIMIDCLYFGGEPSPCLCFSSLALSRARALSLSLSLSCECQAKGSENRGENLGGARLQLFAIN